MIAGYSLILKDDGAGRNITLKEKRTNFEGWKTPYNISQVNKNSFRIKGTNKVPRVLYCCDCCVAILLIYGLGY